MYTILYLHNNYETGTLLAKISAQVSLDDYFMAYLNAEMIFVTALCAISLGEMSRGPTATSSSC